jgi:hypothetical protein
LKYQVGTAQKLNWIKTEKLSFNFNVKFTLKQASEILKFQRLVIVFSVLLHPLYQLFFELKNQGLKPLLMP